MDFLSSIYRFFDANSLGMTLFVFFFFFFLAILSKRLLIFFEKKVSKRAWFLKSLMQSAYKWVFGILSIYGFLLSLEFLQNYDYFLFSQEKLQQLRQSFLLVSLTLMLLSWKKRHERTVIKKLVLSLTSKEDEALYNVIAKLLTLAIFTLTSLIFLDLFGVPLEALLTFGGVGGLAISWASKDIVANFFGGLMIHVNRPFSVGSWIKLPTKNGIEGVVEEIGWYMTCIRNFEKRPLYIPNGLFTDAIIENPGRMHNRRINTSIGLRYEDIQKVKVIVEDIEKLLASHEGIDQTQLYRIHFVEFASSSLDLCLSAYTKATARKAYLAVQQDVFLQIANIIESHGAEVAFPTRTLHFANQMP